MPLLSREMNASGKRFLRLCSSESFKSKKKVAERDIRRLKWNWAFVTLLCSMISISYVSPLSTIHQFIINPTSEELNKTDEKMEPGLQQSETFYSWTFTVLFIGYTISGVVVGVLTNWIPYWYLLFSSTLAHVVGYLLYALATNGWMMILGRLLAGVAMGSINTLTLTYFGVSFETYADSVKMLEKYEEKKAARVKGYVFTLYTVGKSVGHIIGAVFPIILSKCDVDHFRSVGWINALIGVGFLLLQVFMFQGEYKFSHSATVNVKKWISIYATCAEVKVKELCWKIFVSQLNHAVLHVLRERFVLYMSVHEIPLYILLVGGIKGARYVLTEVLVSPILSDQFGFDEKETSYFFLSYSVGQVIGSVVVIGMQYLYLSAFFLTVSGMTSSIVGFLIMTDWQAIPHDPCTNYSLFHHPELADTYRMQLSESPTSASLNTTSNLCIPQPVGQSMQLHGDMYVQSDISWKSFNQSSFRCSVSNRCEQCNHLHVDCIHFVKTANKGICLSHKNLSDTSLMYTNGTLTTFMSCTLQHQKHRSSSCFTLGPEADVLSSSQSFLAEVHIQSLQVVESAVYEIAVNRCESVDNCHWIPNSQVTHKHCSDCQPICRNPKRTLNFAQFVIDVNIFFSTIPLMNTGIMLMMSNSVSKSFQGISFGTMTAFMGIVKSTAPLWLDSAYERVQKRTFLSMLIMVGLFLPLLIGIILLYPRTKNKTEERIPLKTHKEEEDDEETDEETELISNQNSLHSD